MKRGLNAEGKCICGNGKTNSNGACVKSNKNKGTVKHHNRGN